jgi:hypothetical protein
MYSRKLLMMGREDSRNMESFITESESQDGTPEFHPDSAWKQSSKTCMKLTSAECTVENS